MVKRNHKSILDKDNWGEDFTYETQLELEYGEFLNIEYYNKDDYSVEEVRMTIFIESLKENV